MSIGIKYKIYCTTDSKWEETAYVTTGAPTVCPVNGAHGVNSSSVSIVHKKGEIQRIDTPIRRGEDPYVETNNATYEDATLLIYGGTETGEPYEYKAVVSASDTNPTADVRIIDLATSNVICEKTGITFAAADTYYLQNLGIISSLPTTEQIFVAQIRRASGSGAQSVRISFISAFY